MKAITTLRLLYALRLAASLSPAPRYWPTSVVVAMDTPYPMAPLFLMCDRRDIGVHADPKSGIADGLPTVLLYDQVPAGIGLSKRVYELHDDLMTSAHELVSTCTCLDGCPSCVGPAGENGYGGKREALALLEALSVR